MPTIYAAHIVTSEAEALGDPEVIVMTTADETGAAAPVASYPLPEDQDARVVLDQNGWRVVGETASAVDTGYVIVDVEAINIEQVVKHVTFAKTQADEESRRQDLAWRTVLGDAMRDGGSGTRLAAAAGISRERVYQIRDGRR